MKGSLAAALLGVGEDEVAGCGVAAGGGATAGTEAAGAVGVAGVAEAGDEPLLDFFIKSAKGSADTAGAGALVGGAALLSAGASAVAGLLCKAPFGFQSLFF